MGVSAIPPERPLIIWHPLDTPPPGYVKANGAEVSRTAYAWAFEKFGTKYGAGDGVNTFRLGPDLRGEFQRGWDDGRGVDAGRVNGSVQSGQVQRHAHSDYYQTTSLSYVGDGGTASGGTIYQSTESGAYTTSGYTGGNETRPRNVAGLFCVAIAP